MSNVAEKLGDYALGPAAKNIEAEGPRFNIAPTQNSLVLRKSIADPHLLEPVHMRWGLVPSWSKTPSTRAPMINARSETVSEKPSFKAAFKRRRCLVPADGFYEWQQQEGGKVPVHFSMQDDSVFLMAGIWEKWTGHENEGFESYTILTTQANSLISAYHDRMPVILSGNKIEQWLETDLSRLTLADQASFFSPFDSRQMSSQFANPKLNSPKQEGPECLEGTGTEEKPKFRSSVLLQDWIPLSDS
ncbi:SOS response-associated peptidase [Pelagicoccus mobilis]|uniref:Abasic site processing protein n=1 Tax=Pelagicoccus mobilis TaxID=415221 RepID=A0A934S778_9BACT|nr:SOS response-associated peptidase [Pelagicoccus mobilis]